MSLSCPIRRQLLKGIGGAALVSLVPTQAFASRSTQGSRFLSFYNIHTGEHQQGTYWEKGGYVGDTLASFNNLMRDHRQNIEAPMDKRVFDIIYQLQQKLGTDKQVNVISGYRSPKTNAMLSARSSGVAKKSYHMKGMAVDLCIPGVSLKDVRQAALQLNLGGVGYYPKSGFIHVDCGPVRRW
ncbi:DUF882 domain-containing protein [Shewanella sp. A3A]|uniref:Murein endopeptidase K n=1 Tax=Shewanella electrica TaxID=515560 RepID=A0ABT2FPW0_9GAMM|nr:DUF882 domain-containing protein [Shewanella electrica]MCH1919275.1 DUF882 domain-containing protein [Shewanella ferrihydritica]MCH1926737.1 DUF882 domain-containing protein [Shewanella electrica]MCS4558002.1 DUF882 domain-containing protein [Shewanella electrica]